MGTEEEVGKVAVATVESLRGSPLVLGLILINLMFLIGGGYIMLQLGEMIGGRAAVWEETMQRVIEVCIIAHDSSPMPPISPVR